MPSRPAPLRITDEPSGRLEIRAEVASRQLPWGIFAVVLLIIALALSLWSHRHREQERLASHPLRPAQSEQLPAAAETASSPGTSSPANSITESSSSSQSPDNSSPVRSASDIRPVPDASSDKSSSALPQSPESAATLAPGEFAVTVRTRDESWVSISIDGKHTGSEVLEPGDERTFRARTDVVLKAGNSGGVDLLLNGKHLPFAGETDVVKTITIGPSGIVPATAPAQPAEPKPPSN